MDDQEETSISQKSTPSKKWKKFTIFGAGMLSLILIPMIVFTILSNIEISNLNARLDFEGRMRRNLKEQMDTEINSLKDEMNSEVNSLKEEIEHIKPFVDFSGNYYFPI